MIATLSFLVSSSHRSCLRGCFVSAFQSHVPFSLSYQQQQKQQQLTSQENFRRQSSWFMSSSTSASTNTSTNIIKRVKTIDAVPSPETVAIKGWVRTVRKQKTLAFVEVNDGSTLSGIQCVLPFDELDEDSKAGTYLDCFFLVFMSTRHDVRTLYTSIYIYIYIYTRETW